jgi:hypothetical protein
VYVPSIKYNFYDGVIAGMRLFNKTILERPISFDVNPSYSTKSKSLSGSFSVGISQYRRDSNLFNIRYGISAEHFHYAPDANYQRVNTAVNIRFREKDYRDNHRESINFRTVYVNREKSKLLISDFDGSYSIFNARYVNSKAEITKHFGFSNDLQLASKFGKLAGEISYRRLYNDNRQIGLRFFAGTFLYNSTDSNYFNFALDRPSDYLFDFNYLGRSESTGIFSQQFIPTEGTFKSKLQNPLSNQWITTANGTFTVWNWIEAYGDLGYIKNKNTSMRFVYDSGIRLNLVPDYFELYFPVSSSNGWEIAQPHYNQKIRFIAYISTNTIVSLFTRKWF